MTKKYGLDKVALLAILVLSLFLAYLMVQTRSGIRLSGPITLNPFGLSLSIPSGNGWKNEKNWSYQNNEFAIQSVLNAGPSNPMAFVSCHYLLADSNHDPQQLFSSLVADEKGVIIKKGNSKIGSVDFNWLRFRLRNSIFENVFFATAKLPYNRRLDIRIYFRNDQPDLDDKLFSLISKTLKFDNDPSIRQGIDIVRQLKSKGLNSLSEQFSNQNYFVINDAANRPIGFLMDVFFKPEDNNNNNLHVSSYFYLRGPYAREELTSFLGSDNLNKFVWKSETKTPNSASGAILSLDSNDTLVVKKLISSPGQKSYRISPLSIPEIFLAKALAVFEKSENNNITLDLLEADGTITPIILKKSEDPKQHVLTIELLNGTEFTEQVFLDQNFLILKRILHQQNTYIIERTSPDSLIQQFPERADYIVHNSSI